MLSRIEVPLTVREEGTRDFTGKFLSGDRIIEGTANSHGETQSESSFFRLGAAAWTRQIGKTYTSPEVSLFSRLGAWG